MNSVHLHIARKAKPFLGPLTINNFTEVIIKIIVYFLQKICIFFKSDHYENWINVQTQYWHTFLQNLYLFLLGPWGEGGESTVRGMQVLRSGREEQSGKQWGKHQEERRSSLSNLASSRAGVGQDGKGGDRARNLARSLSEADWWPRESA